MAGIIVYTIDNLYRPTERGELISVKVNWLAENTDYQVHLVMADSMSRMTYYPLSEKVIIDKLEVNFYKLRETFFAIRPFCYLWKWYIYKKRLIALLDKLRADVTVVSTNEEIDFIYTLQDRSIKIAEHYETSKSATARLKRLAPKVNYIEGIGITDEQAALDWGIKSTLIIPNPHPILRLPMRKSNCEPHRVIALGKYTGKEEFQRLVSVWRETSKRNPDWTLDVYETKHPKMLRQMLGRQELINNIQSYPIKEFTPEKYVNYSIFIECEMVMLYDYKMFDAMAHGIPCMGYAYRIIPDGIIQNEKNGFLIYSVTTPSDFAFKLSLLMRDDELRKKMGKNARNMMKRYDTDTTMRMWSDEFSLYVTEDPVPGEYISYPKEEWEIE